MYRRRRIIAGIAAVLLVGFAVFCVYSLARGAGAVVGILRRDDLTALNRGDVPEVKDDKNASGVKTCTSDDVKLELRSAAQQVAVGGAIRFTATIAHVGKGSCLIDSSSVSRVLTITSGKDTVWKSNVCPVNSHMLLMAQGDKDIQTITWNTNRTGTRCEQDAYLPKVDRGTYIAKLTMRDIPGLASEQVPILVE